jgi:hypothetical protein
VSSAGICLEDFEDAYARWAAGRCPCCGAALDWWTTPPEAIGEGVMLCGRCIENKHHLAADEFVPVMLMAIAQGAVAAR